MRSDPRGEDERGGAGHRAEDVLACAAHRRCAEHGAGQAVGEAFARVRLPDRRATRLASAEVDDEERGEAYDEGQREALVEDAGNGTVEDDDHPEDRRIPEGEERAAFGQREIAADEGGDEREDERLCRRAKDPVDDEEEDRQEEPEAEHRDDDRHPETNARRGDELAEAQLAILGRETRAQIELRGASIPLSPRSAEIIGMALHELATNALKYGALSSLTGKVVLCWEETADRFVIDWRESGVPVVCQPTHHGFGTTLMRHIPARSLNADVTIDYAPTGLRWRLECSLATARMLES